MLEAPLPLIPVPAGGPRHCAGCSAVLADDQRYCVRCGAPAPGVPWTGAEIELEAAPAVVAGPGSTTRLPAPRSTALLTLLVLAVGVFIGGAFGPPSPDTLADESERPVVVVAGNASPAPAPVRPVSPAEGSTPVFGDTGGAGSAGSGGGAGSSAGPASPVAGVAAATEPSESRRPAHVPAGEGAPGSGTTTPSATLPPIKHVFVVALSTPDAGHLLGADGPAYLRSELAARGARLSAYRGVAAGLGGRIATI